MLKKILCTFIVLFMAVGIIPSALVNAEESNDVAEISGVKYTTLSDAVDATNPGDTIKILNDMTLTESIVYNLADGVTLDLNDKTLTIKQDTAKFVGTNIVIKNGFIDAYNNKTNYPLYIGDGNIKTDAVVQNLDVKNGGIYVKNNANVTFKDNTINVGNKSKYAVIVEDKGNAIIESGTYFGGKDGHDVLCWKKNIIVTGGTFKRVHVKNYVPDDCNIINNIDGTYTVLDFIPVARVNCNWYKTLQDAIDSANAGDVVTLANNLETAEQILIEKDLTLNLGDYVIESSHEVAALRIVPVDKSIEVIIDANNGGIKSEGYAIFSGNIPTTVAQDAIKTALIINGGNYVAEATSAIYHNNGLCTINGGSYRANGVTDKANGKDVYNTLVLNNKDFYLGEFMINGGKFYGFNPACMSINKHDHHDHDSIAEGKTAVRDADGWYSLVEGKFTHKIVCDCSAPASAHQHCYASLEDAEAALKDNDCRYDKIVEITE